MHAQYTIRLPDFQRRAYANLMHLNPRMAAITRIWVPPRVRGLGYARKLLARILADADHQDITLLANPLSDGTGLTTQQPIAWYERLGFRPQPGHVSFVRVPVFTAPHP